MTASDAKWSHGRLGRHEDGCFTAKSTTTLVIGEAAITKVYFVTLAVTGSYSAAATCSPAMGWSTS